MPTDQFQWSADFLLANVKNGKVPKRLKLGEAKIPYRGVYLPFTEYSFQSIQEPKEIASLEELCKARGIKPTLAVPILIDQAQSDGTKLEFAYTVGFEGEWYLFVPRDVLYPLTNVTVND